MTHFDCASVAEVALVRQMFSAASIGAPTGFLFFGPTCDSADVMRGSFHLPADIAEGDWIEIGQLGAYVACLRAAFNGFDRARLVEVCDAPLLHAAGLFAWPRSYGGGGATAPGATDPISQSRNSAIFGVSAVASGATM